MLATVSCASMLSASLEQGVRVSRVSECSVWPDFSGRVLCASICAPVRTGLALLSGRTL